MIWKQFSNHEKLHNKTFVFVNVTPVNKSSFIMHGIYLQIKNKMPVSRLQVKKSTKHMFKLWANHKKNQVFYFAFG